MSECIHPKLQLQLVVPEECFERGDIGAWYKCVKCDAEFSTALKPYKIEVVMGVPKDKHRPASSPSESREET